jgi:hypothetical protein
MMVRQVARGGFSQLLHQSTKFHTWAWIFYLGMNFLPGHGFFYLGMISLPGYYISYRAHKCKQNYFIPGCKISRPGMKLPTQVSWRETDLLKPNSGANPTIVSYNSKIVTLEVVGLYPGFLAIHFFACSSLSTYPVNLCYQLLCFSYRNLIYRFLCFFYQH